MQKFSIEILQLPQLTRTGKIVLSKTIPSKIQYDHPITVEMLGDEIRDCRACPVRFE